MSVLRRLVLVVLTAVFCWSPFALAAQSVAGEIRQMTGARTKIAWIRSSKGLGHPFGPMDPAPTWRIVVMDTDENGGQERYLTPEFNTYNHVMITPSGKQVIWTIGGEKVAGGGVWIANWDGTGVRKLLDAELGVGVAEDGGAEWVYFKAGKNEDGITAVWRCRIDDTSKKELIWDKTNSNDKWEFTRDGKLAASGLPWPRAGFANLPNGEFKLYGDGCTPSMAGDGKHMACMIATGHRGVYMFDAGGTNSREIDFTRLPGAEGMNSPQFWWCSFARYDGRFYTFSGPHPSMSYIPRGSNIYFCQFNDKWTGFDKVVIVTDDPEMDTQSYVWIDANRQAGSLGQVTINAKTAPKMTGPTKQAVTMSIANDGAAPFAGSAKLALPDGWACEPAKLDIQVPAGSKKEVTINIVPPARVPVGKTPMWVATSDATGRQIDYLRLPFDVAPPFSAEAVLPQALNVKAQPLAVRIKNVSEVPVSGTVQVEVKPAPVAEGQAAGTALPPVSKAFETIAVGEERLVTLDVPNLDLLTGDYQASFAVTGNDVLMPVNSKLNASRYWLMEGPTLAKCQYVSPQCIVVEFNESVQAAPKVEAVFASGAAVTSCEFNDNNRRLTIQLAKPLSVSDRLTLKGIVDVSPAHAPFAGTLDVVAPSWPSSSSGLVFLWDNARRVNGIYDEAGKSLKLFEVYGEGKARMDRFGRLMPDGGRFGTRFMCQTGKGQDFAPIVASNAFTLEATIQTAETEQQPSGRKTAEGEQLPCRIVNLSAWHENDWNIMLGQLGDRLLFSSRTTDNFLTPDGKPAKEGLHGRAPVHEIFRFTDKQPHHVVLTYEPGVLKAYVDGKKAYEAKETGNLKWGFGELYLSGHHNNGGHTWKGMIEGFALYSRVMSEAEVRANASAMAGRARARTASETAQVRAKLLRKSGIPESVSVRPWRDAMVVNEYEVIAVDKPGAGGLAANQLKAGQKIRVAQWAVVERGASESSKAEEGSEVLLSLEEFKGNRDELELAPISDTLSKSDIALLYDASR